MYICPFLVAGDHVANLMGVSSCTSKDQTDEDDARPTVYQIEFDETHA